MSVQEIKEPIYFESVLTAENNPHQTLYNCECMLAMLGTLAATAEGVSEEAVVGHGLILHQVRNSINEINENYDIVPKK